MRALSGEQIEIHCGAQHAVVATVGATLRTYVVGDRAVVDGFRADEVCPGGRGQALLPWPNRIGGGRYDLAGQSPVLQVDEVELGPAMHGLVCWAEWIVEERTASSVRLRHRLAARPGYPFPLDCAVTYRLAASGLTVTIGATNIG